MPDAAARHVPPFGEGRRKPRPQVPQGLAFKEHMANSGLDPAIREQLWAMEWEEQETGRITHEEALQRVNRKRELGKDGHNQLLLSLETVQIVMLVEYRKVGSAAKAA